MIASRGRPSKARSARPSEAALRSPRWATDPAPKAEELPVIRLGPEGPLGVGQGPSEVLPEREGQPALAVEAGDFRVQPDGPVEVGHRPVEVPQALAAEGAMVIGPGPRKWDPADELVQREAAPAPLAQRGEGRAADGVGGRQAGVEPQGGIAVGDRPEMIGGQLPGLGPALVSGGNGRIEADRLVEVGDGAAGLAGLQVGVGPRPEGGPVVRPVAESGGQAVDFPERVGSGDDDGRGGAQFLVGRRGGRRLHRYADDLPSAPRQREPAGREPEAVLPLGELEVVVAGGEVDPAAGGGVDDRHQSRASLDLDPDPRVGRLDDELPLIAEDADDLRAEGGPRPGDPQDRQEGQADRESGTPRRGSGPGPSADSTASSASTTARADPGRPEGSRASSEVMSAEAADGSPGLSRSGGSGVARASAARTASASGPGKGTRPVVIS